MLDQLRAGDVVVVSRLDRLARPTRDLLEIAEQLKEAGAVLRSLHEPWADTTSPGGRMVLTVFAGIAEFERELIQDRTRAGRTAARARGVRFGRPPKLTAERIALARRCIGPCVRAHSALAPFAAWPQPNGPWRHDRWGYHPPTHTFCSIAPQHPPTRGRAARHM